MDDEQNEDAEPVPDTSTAKPKWNQLAIISVIVGILPYIIFSFLLCIINNTNSNSLYMLTPLFFFEFVYIPLSALTGLVCSIIGIVQIRRYQERGLIIGIFGLLLSLILCYLAMFYIRIST